MANNKENQDQIKSGSSTTSAQASETKQVYLDVLRDTPIPTPSPTPSLDAPRRSKMANNTPEQIKTVSGLFNKVVDNAYWVLDSLSVMDPTTLSTQEVIECNDCNGRLVLAKRHLKTLKTYISATDMDNSNNIGYIKYADSVVSRADALVLEVLAVIDSGNIARAQAGTHYVPPNQIPFNSDAFEKRKDVTSVSLSRAQVLVTRPLVPAGEEKEALASLEDGIGAHAPVDVQALVTRPLAPAVEEKEVFKIKATKLLLLMKKMSCLVELKLEMTSANLAALSSGGRRNQVPGRSSLANAKQDLVLPQVLVTRPLASAGEGHEALASLEDEKEALASLEDLKDARAPVKDLIPVEAHVLVSRPLAPAGHDEKGASLEDGKGARAPVEDLIPVDVQVLVTGPREELVLLLGKISSLWALKIKPLKILILMSKYLSPISASPRLQEVQQCLKDEEGARARVEDLVPVGGHVLVTRLFAPAVEENEALASLEEEKEALASREDEAHVLVTKLALVTGCSALWVVEIKPLKLLVFKIKPFKLLLLMKKMSRLAELKLTSANLAALSSVVLGHSTREDLVLLLGKISSLWALKIKPLKILADKGRYVRGYSIQTLY
jgi:hypothetical protein